ncbi:MAG: LapA family protein [Woeseiaceae bacterium]|nr:LapA family protein [Woeseiaceae bacterium]
MFKRAALLVVVVALGIAMFAFTSVNSGDLQIDLLFMEVSTSVPVAFAVAFASGWVFGLLSLSLWAVKLLNERRALKRALRASESEVTSLRNLPLSDAD